VSLELDKSTWKRLRLGDVIRRSRKQADPIEQGIERYVAGGHIDSDSIIVERWGDPSDGQMGSTFRYVFEPGQTLFVSARPYLRKVGVVDFSGVVADKTYVLDAIPENGLIQEFLPFVLSSDRFIEYATIEATGSMNPRLLWGPLQRYEFDLPPLNEQKRLADLLWAVEHHRLALKNLVGRIAHVRGRWIEAGLPDNVGKAPMGEAAQIKSGITLGPARRSMPDQVPYLRVANVQRGVMDLSEIKDVGATPAEIKARGLQRGDVLVVEGHASVDEIGRAAIWDRDESPLYQNHLFCVRASTNFRSKFLLEWINSVAGRAYIRTVAKSTSGLNTINSTVLKAMPVPAVSIEEQDDLLGGVDLVDTAMSALRSELATVTGVRSSLIASIFGGN
jgi:type I restriction enzyme S subunit